MSVLCLIQPLQHEQTTDGCLVMPFVTGLFTPILGCFIASEIVRFVLKILNIVVTSSYLEVASCCSKQNEILLEESMMETNKNNEPVPSAKPFLSRKVFMTGQSYSRGPFFEVTLTCFSLVSVGQRTRISGGRQLEGKKGRRLLFPGNHPRRLSPLDELDNIGSLCPFSVGSCPSDTGIHAGWWWG